MNENEILVEFRNSRQIWGNQDNLTALRFRSFLNDGETMAESIVQFLIIMMWIWYIDMMILMIRLAGYKYTICISGSPIFQLVYCRIFGKNVWIMYDFKFLKPDSS